MRYFLPILLFSLLLPCSAIASSQLTGTMSVVDGDTLKLKKQRIRLKGVDAPEQRQTCQLNGRMWNCGKDATAALHQLIGTQSVRCEVIGKDQYKRPVAICYVGDLNLNQWLVQNGWAVSYPDYTTDRTNKPRKLLSAVFGHHSSRSPKIGVGRIANIIQAPLGQILTSPVPIAIAHISSCHIVIKS